MKKKLILKESSVSGFPDFRPSLCAKQPGEMDIRLRMYIMKANCEVFKHKLNI